MSTRTLIATGIIWISGWSVYAQEHLKGITTLHLQKVTVEQVLTEITAETGVRFSYNPDILPGEKFTVNFDSVSIQTVLDNVLGTDYRYKVRGSYIIIQPALNTHHSKSTVKVTGKILDAATGNKLQNTTIYDVNTLQPTLSESDGSYELTSTAGSDDIAVLAISKINYQDTIIRVSRSQAEPINLSLRPLTTKNESEPERDSSRLVEIFVSRESQEHVRNVKMKENRFAQISLFPVLGSNGQMGGNITNHFSLNLVSGYANGMEGMELGGVLNINRQGVTGFQAAGFGNITGGKTEAFQIAGFWNHNTDTVSGVQMAGFGNFVTAEVRGTQLAGFSNKAKSLEGLQLAGFINHVTARTAGVQISGCINHTGTLSGVQIGVINRADTIQNGLMFGLVNLNRNGMIDYEFEYNDITPANFTFRSGANWFYTILTTGVDVWTEELFSFGAGFGSHWDVIRLGRVSRIYLESELTANNIHSLRNPVYSDFSLDSRFQLNLGISLTRNLSLNAGGILHYYMYYPGNDAGSSFSDRLGDEPLYTDTVGSTFMKVWTGKRLGLRWKI